MLMTTTKTEQPRGFRVAGEVDMSNQGALSRMLAREAAADGDLTLDLSELRFIDSRRRSGVAADGPGPRGARGAAAAGGNAPVDPEDLRPHGGRQGAGRRAGGRCATCAHPADQAGGTHPVAEAQCACGCPYLYAADDLALFWEAGERFGSGCTDHSCECHVAPLRG